MNGDHDVQLARLDERDRALDRRLSGMETKLDIVVKQVTDLRVRVAGWSALVGGLTSLVVAVVSQAVRT